MSHKYDNFADAFAAATGAYAQTKQFLTWSYNSIWLAYTNWQDPVTIAEVHDIASSVTNLINGVTYIMGTTAPAWDRAWLYEMFYWQNQEGAAVDMDAIIYAMLTAEPDEINYFIGLEEAFKQFVWNRPFNQEFYAAIARGFAL